ncbi:stage II sporulation protein M [Haloferacaceae archaeon DSL9]
MTLASALRSGGRLLVDRPGSILPAYLLGSGLLLAARVPLFVALGIAVVVLAAQGRIEPAIDELAAFAERVDEQENGFETANPDQLPPGLEDAIAGLVTPTVAGLLLLGVLLSAIVSVLLWGLSNAATLNAVYATLCERDGVEGAVRGIGRDWKAFVGLAVAQLLAFLFALTPIGVGALGFAVDPAIGVLGVLVGALVSVGLVLLALLAFAFAGQAIVVDRVGTLGAIRRGAGFVVRRPVAFVGYVVVAVGVAVATGALSALFDFVGIGRATALVGPLVATPFLDGFKTALYADVAIGPADRGSVRGRFAAAIGDGWRALGGFVRRHPLANLASGAVFAGSIAAGWYLTAGADVLLSPADDIATIFGTIAIGPFVNIAANNWFVAATSAYGGVAAGVPTIVSLAFNGVIVGALGGVYDPVAFVALVAPHGIVEVPALVVSGGLGLYLGGIVVGRLRRTRDTDAVVGAVRLTYRALLGLVVVFVVAAFIEAFLTPQIGAFVLG